MLESPVGQLGDFAIIMILNLGSRYGIVRVEERK